MSKTPATDALEKRFRRQGKLNGISEQLGWDMMTMMPEGSGEVRADQLAELASIKHEVLTHPENEDLLARAESEPLEDWRRANLREMRHHYQHATAVPTELVERLTREAAQCEKEWEQARKNNDYKSFLPRFSNVIGLLRETADAKSAALGLNPYDAMLDYYDPGMRSAQIDPIFADLKTWLPDLADRVIAEQADKPALPLPGPLARDAQAALSRDVLKSMGFDTEHGRIDVSAHPFCGGTPGDVRITTRYSDHDLGKALYSTIHEGGHAAYEQNLPAAWRNLPIGLARGMTLHESQSLFMEKQIGLSSAFIRYLEPQLAKHFDAKGPAWKAKNLERLMTNVERSMIRTEADEVTYPLHVILRYELERALLSGELNPKDLPAAWNEKMQQYLGIIPANDAEGCLQDSHWPGGAIGYFPTYTLGAMTAAQIMALVRRDIPGLEAQIAKGNFAPLNDWLREHVHQQASMYPTPDLIAQATGEPLNPAHFRTHLESRYLGKGHAANLTDDATSELHR